MLHLNELDTLELPELARPSEAFLRSQALVDAALTQRLRAWETRKARLIESWVRKNMKSVDFSVAMAPASEVAHTLAGDCTEYSMLTAAMCKAEGDAGPDDRRPAPVAGEQRVTETAERQLLDDRREDCDHDAVRHVGSGVLRLPGLRSDALLTVGMEQRSEENRQEVLLVSSPYLSCYPRQLCDRL